jgi:putative lipoprotein
MPGFTWILLAGSLTFGGPRRESPADRWLAKDKLYHFTASAVIQSAGHSVLRANGHAYRDAAWTAAGITMGLGVAKELWDRSDGRYVSWRDLGADAAGTGTGAILMRQAAP